VASTQKLQTKLSEFTPLPRAEGAHFMGVALIAYGRAFAHLFKIWVVVASSRIAPGSGRYRVGSTPLQGRHNSLAS
jgi:hypothetical protein